MMPNMNFLNILAIYSILITAVHGKVVVDSVPASSCIYYLDKTFNWNCTSTKVNPFSYRCQCPNQNWVASITNCIADISDSEDQRIHAFKNIQWQCSFNAFIDYSLDDLEAAYSNNTKKLVTPSDLKAVVSAPVLTNLTAIEPYQEAFNDVIRHVKKTQWFGYVLNMYWGFIIISSILISYFKSLMGYDWSRSRFANTRFVNTVRSSLIHSALISDRFNESYLLFGVFPINLPSRIQSIILGVFWILLISFTVFDISPIFPNAYIPNKLYIHLDYIGYRSGILAFSTLPLTFLLAIKNNPVDILTGWSRTTSITFHKSLARATALNAVIHSVVWLIYAIKDDQVYWRVTQYPIRFAISGLLIMLGLVVFSVKFFRNIMYETFLIFHKLFAIFLIVTMLGHCNVFGWLGWIYAILAIYIYDKVASWVKVIYYGGIESAHLEKFSDSDIVKVTINKPKHYKYHSGMFNYIQFMKPMKYAWQAHPFTVNLKKSVNSNEEKLIIIFKIKNGITKEIAHFIDVNGVESMVTMPVILEAPFGHGRPLNNHENYVFICCGLGMAAVYSHIVELADFEDSTRDAPLVQVYWITRSDTVLDWFEEELQYLCDRGVSVELLITRPASAKYKERNEKLPIEPLSKMSKRKSLAAAAANFYKRSSAMSVISFDSNDNDTDPHNRNQEDLGNEILDLYAPDAKHTNPYSSVYNQPAGDYYDIQVYPTPSNNPNPLEYPAASHAKSLSHSSSQMTLDDEVSGKGELTRSSTLMSEATYKYTGSAASPFGKISRVDTYGREISRKKSIKFKKSIDMNYLTERPNTKKIVKESKMELSTAYICCGPPKFNDSMRSAVNEEIKFSKQRVDYYEESFEW